MEDRTKLTLTDGKILNVAPLSLMVLEAIEEGVENEFRSEGKLIDHPTYTLETAGGGEEEHLHDKESAEEFGVEEDWQKFVETTEELDAVQNDRRTRYVLLEGITNFPLPDDDAWIKRQQKYGVSDIPKYDDYVNLSEDEYDDLLIYYRTTEVMKTPHDTGEASLRILSLTYHGVDEGVISKMEESFRDRYSGRGRGVQETDDSEVDAEHIEAGEQD